MVTSKKYKKLIIITAPSGAGKTTIARALMKQIPELALTISVTTRAPRSGEVDGVDYYFVSVDEFKNKIEKEAFLEYEKVYERKYYGTLYSELEKIWDAGKIPIRIVDVKGAANLKRQFKEKSCSIFIKPPSFNILQKRLTLRNAEAESDIQERLNRVSEEMKYQDKFDHIILNDDLQTAVQKTKEIITHFIPVAS